MNNIINTNLHILWAIKNEKNIINVQTTHLVIVIYQHW